LFTEEQVVVAVLASGLCALLQPTRVHDAKMCNARLLQQLACERWVGEDGTTVIASLAPSSGLLALGTKWYSKVSP
jgi:hypothetical protein